MARKHKLLFLISICAVSVSYSQNVTTLAGQSGISGATNGTGIAASFNGPHGIVCDGAGNVYVADRNNNKIRKVTPAGIVTTFAGSGLAGSTDGTGSSASFFEPWGITIDNAGNLYVADTKNYKIRKISPAGVVTTFAGDGTSGVTDGSVATAQFGFPTGITADNSGAIYVSEYMTHTIRKINNGMVTTFAGAAFLSGDVNGTGGAARFNHPHSIVADAAGNIYVTDAWNNKIKKITPSASVTTFAGNGIAGFTNGGVASAMFNNPMGLTTDNNGVLYVGDVNNFCLRKIENGTVSTFAGTPGSAGDANGPLLQAKFNSPTCLVFTQPAMFYIGDEGNELIRAIDLTQNSLPLTLSTSTGATTFCTGTAATLTATPSGLTTYIFKDGANIIATNGTGVLSLASLSAGSHSISCTATGNSGSYASLSAFSVTIIGASTASVMPAGPVSICNGSPVMLTASAGTSYQWSNGATTPSISVNQPGNYNVTVTYTAGCTSQSNVVTVVAGGNFSATITPANPPSICAGDSILLAASNGVSYLWSNGKTTQYIYVNTPGNYAVTVTNNSGCTATSSVVSLVVNTLPVASVIPAGPVTIMQGQTITLTANAASGYLWSTGATTASIAVSQPGTYWVKVRNAADCYSAPVSVVVNVNPITSVNITAYGDTIICPGDSVQLTSSSFFGNQWYKNNVAIPLATFQTYYAKDAGIYTVSVLVGNTTLISNPITIALKSVPATLDVTGDTICSGGAAELSLVPEAGVIYQWYEQPTGGNYIAVGYTLTISELYQTTVYYINQIANGCSSLQRIPITAYVWPSLGLSFNASEAVKELTGFRVQFQNNTPDQNLLWNWDFGDGMSGSVSSDAQPVYVYAAEGTYAVTLTASNSRGCSESFTKMIEVGVAHDLFLPSAFTPNNDGVNDIFRLKGSGFTAATMSILNQWSQLIFKTDHAASGWDGQVKGALAPNGTYVYVVKITLPDGKEKVMKGNISLIK